MEWEQLQTRQHSFTQPARAVVDIYGYSRALIHSLVAPRRRPSCTIMFLGLQESSGLPCQCGHRKAMKEEMNPSSAQAFQSSHPLTTPHFKRSSSPWTEMIQGQSAGYLRRDRRGMILEQEDCSNEICRGEK